MNALGEIHRAALPYSGYLTDHRLRRLHALGQLLKRFATGDHRVLLCGTCMDARGLTDGELMEGARRSTMDVLAEATAAADKVLVF